MVNVHRRKGREDSRNDLGIFLFHLLFLILGNQPPGAVILLSLLGTPRVHTEEDDQNQDPADHG